MTRDYINNYVCNRLMHVCMYQVIELYDYIVLCVTHATIVLFFDGVNIDKTTPVSAKLLEGKV